MFRDGFQRKLRTRRREAAARMAAEEKCLRRRKREPINAHGENQDVLERVHVSSVFQQLRAFEGVEKIPFHGGKSFARDGIARDENEFHRRC